MTRYPDADPHRAGPASVTETLAPYLGTADAGPFAKLSISLPEPLLAAVREVAAETGVPVSGVIAASIRRLVDEVAQAKLDAALDEDNAEGLRFAEAAVAGQAQLLGRLEW